jgi:hypothetical protein
MLTVMDQQWLEMTPTASYSRRWALWTPGISFISKDRNVQGHYAASIHQQCGQRSGNKIYSDQYQVVFMGEVIGGMCFQFVFEDLNPEPPKSPNERIGPYLVTVGPNAFECSCMATVCKVDVCKHRSLACRAIAAGLVDGAKPWAGMPEQEEQETESGSWFDPDFGEVGLFAEACA